MFLFAALCIHLVCLDPDLSGALEIHNGSGSRACISPEVSRHCCNHSKLMKKKNQA